MSSRNGRRVNASRSGAGFPLIADVFKARNFLLTGATGFLGKVWLYLMLRWHPEVDRIYLLIRGDKRSSLSRFRREILDSPVMAPLREHLGSKFDHYIEEKIFVVPGDITEDGLIAPDGDRFKRGALDAVVHCAGLVNFEASLEKGLLVNTFGVANVLDFCRKTGAAIMHISTCYSAGHADGHRFEDDIPIDWCPDDRRRGFKLQREIRDARAAVDRIEAGSHDQVQQSEFRTHADDDDHDPREGVQESRRKRWIEDRLKEEGLQRALKWGWPNTYSYTKSMGEQLVLAARDELDAAVVRPAVIESAMRDPFPGWNGCVAASAAARRA